MFTRIAFATAAAAALFIGTSSSAQADRAQQKLDDATIVAIFDGANTADIETGELAVARGTNVQVRDFGAMLARDHKEVRQMGRDLAGKLGVTPTPLKDDPYARAHAEAMTHLRTLKGAEFDHAFLQHEVVFHQVVIDAINSTLRPAIQNAELKTLVNKVTPAFEAHRLAAKALDEALFKGAASSSSHGH